MQKPHPDPWGQVPVGHRAFINLLNAAGDGQSAYWEIVEQAVEEWMRRHSQDNCGEPEFAGYQWKGLFLPHGTVLRTVFHGKNHHCRVECDQIMYEGKAHSPSGFVNAVGGIRRNAWKSVWLLFPDSKHWQLADALRARKHPVAPRRAAHAARPIKVQPAATGPAKAPATPSVRLARPTPQPAASAVQADPLVPDRSTLFAAPFASSYRWSARPASP